MKQKIIILSVLALLVLSNAYLLFDKYQTEKAHDVSQKEYFRHVEEMNQFRERMARFGVTVPPTAGEINPENH